MIMSKRRKAVEAVGILMGGIGGATVAAFIEVYDRIFPRFERPDYDLKPGIYCYDRISKELPREELDIASKKNKLRAYYYKQDDSLGLVVVAHGMHSGADDYLPIIKYLYDNKFNVLSFNYTGTYESEGDSTVGMCQSLIDLDNVIEYIQNNDEFKNQSLFLLGHSWGGYAVSSVIALKKNIKAVAAIAPMNDGYNMFLEKGQQYAGKAGLMPKPFFDVYQKYLFRKYTEYNGLIGINSADIPVLVAQGIDDKVITFDGQSIMAHKDEITNPNVKYYIGKGLCGDHDDIWHSVDSIVYRLECESDLKLLKIQKGDSLTDEEKKEYYKTIDHYRYSEVNKDLMNQIIDLFKEAL